MHQTSDRLTSQTLCQDIQILDQRCQHGRRIQRVDGDEVISTLPGSSSSSTR
jgi:hypothetical protein